MLYSQNKHANKTYFCTYCLHGFSREDLLEKHKPLCKNYGIQHTVLPDEQKQVDEVCEHHKNAEGTLCYLC